jgi:DNA polymerase IV (DinB-like DNA polymerase)
MIGKRRIIVHLDVDHFFTAAEEKQRPELKGKPVVVGADPKEGRGRGVVSTANYEARMFGIRSGMPISKAWKLCPQAAYLQPDFKLYTQVSNEIMSLLRMYTDKFEQWGIDEAFLDVTSKAKDRTEAENLALRIKARIKENQDLTCSIGIGPTKLVAKIATDIEKPDGLTTVKDKDTEGFLAPLPVRKLLWVGRKTERKLQNMGIRTIGDLANHDPTILTETLGSLGTQLYLLAHGMDKSEVEEREDTKSISRETTFQEDTSDPQLLLQNMHNMTEQVQKEALEQHLSFKTITIKIRYENFETHTRGKTLSFMTSRLQDLNKAAKELLTAHVKPERKIRLIGVKVSNLVETDKQKTLL